MSVRFDPAKRLTKKDLFTTEEAIRRFGTPGEGKGAEARLVTFTTPYRMRLYVRGASLNVSRIRCHELVAPWAEAALSMVKFEYGEKEIARLGLDVFTGSYVPRLMRNSKTEWSKHAFGIALDFLGNENGNSTPFAKATFSRPEYKVWLDCWQASGFANLGRVEGVGRDAMHFEFCKWPE